MRALIVYEPAGEDVDRITHEVARGIATVMDTEVVAAERALGRLDRDVALLVLGAPTTGAGLSRRWMRVPEQRRADERHADGPGRREDRAGHPRAGLREWLALLPWASEAPATAVFDVVGAGHGDRARGARSAAVDVTRLLRRRRYDTVGQPASFRGAPDGEQVREMERARARAWGAEAARAALAPSRRRSGVAAPRALPAGA